MQVRILWNLVSFKNVAAFAKHHVTVTTCLAFVDTAVEMDGRVMIALMFYTGQHVLYTLICFNKVTSNFAEASNYSFVG
uniref:Uncharacterized protein n=1 Tax=Magallana gigas TaxID=29159 RepID=K1QQZ9_MAGGI